MCAPFSPPLLAPALLPPTAAAARLCLCLAAVALPPLEVLGSEVRLPALHPVMQGFGPPLYGILLLQVTARFW